MGILKPTHSLTNPAYCYDVLLELCQWLNAICRQITATLNADIC